VVKYPIIIRKEESERITAVESRWIKLYKPRKEFKTYSILEPLTRLPVF
jgi:hypothetical protein